LTTLVVVNDTVEGGDDNRVLGDETAKIVGEAKESAKTGVFGRGKLRTDSIFAFDIDRPSEEMTFPTYSMWDKPNFHFLALTRNRFRRKR
jgi:hypothetical protein